MTVDEYYDQIQARCESLGVWKEAFAWTAHRLAGLYVRIDEADAQYDQERKISVTHINTVGAETMSRNPLLIELGSLYDQALVCERELGLTAASLKKIKGGDALMPRRVGGLEQALRVLENPADQKEG